MRSRMFPIILSLSFFLAACSGGEPVSLENAHVHGLAVDRSDNTRLYIATHNGLFVLTNDGSTLRQDSGQAPLTTGSELTLVGSSRDDFMGFSPHPTNPKTLFSSGHPKRGGNLGVLTSTNGGKTWTKIHNGDPGGPADFHAMLVHPANPDHLYGWYKLRVHRSLDQGKTWEVLPKQPPEILAFAGDPENDSILYAGTIGDLLMSRDRGENWQGIVEELKKDVVFDIEVDQRSNLIIATRDHGFMRASRKYEDGFNFETIGYLPNADTPYYVALDPKNPQILYAFGKGHVLYKSTDGGKAWQKLL